MRRRPHACIIEVVGVEKVHSIGMLKLLVSFAVDKKGDWKGYYDFITS